MSDQPLPYPRWEYDDHRFDDVPRSRGDFSVPNAVWDDDPVYTIRFGASWLGHVLGVLEALDQYDAWRGSDAEIFEARQAVREIIASVAIEELPLSAITDIRIVNGQLQYEKDAAWVDVDAPALAIGNEAAIVPDGQLRIRSTSGGKAIEQTRHDGFNTFNLKNTGAIDGGARGNVGVEDNLLVQSGRWANLSGLSIGQIGAANNSYLANGAFYTTAWQRAITNYLPVLRLTSSLQNARAIFGRSRDTTGTPVMDDLFSVDMNPTDTAFRFLVLSSIQPRDAARIVVSLDDSTDATRRGAGALIAEDNAGQRNALGWGTNGTAPTLGFYGASKIPRPTVTGERDANPALASLLDALELQGLIIDSTSVGSAPLDGAPGADGADGAPGADGECPDCTSTVYTEPPTPEPGNELTQICAIVEEIEAWHYDSLTALLDAVDAASGITSILSIFLGNIKTKAGGINLSPIANAIDLITTVTTDALRAAYTPSFRDDMRQLLYCIISANGSWSNALASNAPLGDNNALILAWRDEILEPIELNPAKEVYAVALNFFFPELWAERAYIGGLDTSNGCTLYECEEQTDPCITLVSFDPDGAGYELEVEGGNSTIITDGFSGNAIRLTTTGGGGGISLFIPCDYAQIDYGFYIRSAITGGTNSRTFNMAWCDVNKDLILPLLQNSTGVVNPTWAEITLFGTNVRPAGAVYLRLAAAFPAGTNAGSTIDFDQIAIVDVTC